MKKELVEAVIIGTHNGSIVWSKVKNILASETSHHYGAKLNDNTQLELSVDLDKNLLFESVGILQVMNKELPNGNLYIHRSDVDNKTVELGKDIYNKYIKQNLNFRYKTEDQILSGIINAIPEAKAFKREQRIDEILNTKTETLVDVEPETKTEKKKHWLWG